MKITEKSFYRITNMTVGCFNDISLTTQRFTKDSQSGPFKILDSRICNNPNYHQKLFGVITCSSCQKRLL